ncbi:hypothetical protein OUZ56_005323 [Daphnia magna]|uniref:Uncharacterized protein n=1 Tax=Daphnia magna TaxID=35525 RepID=A0ABQ9YSP8_9CRUS|nr:hypothetical protein OUZ56_005323 [Daphnia magna]
MNDDVVTGGHKLVHSPVNKHSRPEITVTLPDQETVARSLDFDNLTTETQFAPDTLQSGRTLETTAEAISRSASPVLNPKVHPKNSQLRKLRSNAAYKAVAGLDTTPSRKTGARATSEVASGKRSPYFFAKFAERISPSKSPPKLATKTSSLASTVLDQGEQASVPNTGDQEPERERSGFPVERSEGADPDNSADTGHPTDEAISRRPEPIDGVEETNDPTEVLDVLEVKLSAQSKKTTVTEQQTSELKAIFTSITDLQKGKATLELILNCGTTYRHREDQYRHLSQEVEDLSIHLQTLDNFPGASRPNHVQLVEEIKQTLSQTKTQMKQLLSPDITGQISQQSMAPQQVPPLSRTPQPPIPVRHTAHRPIRQPHNQHTNRHNLSPEQRSRRTADVVANLDRLRAAFQHSLRLRNREI